VKLNRRQFLKVLGITSVAAFVDPLKALEGVARGTYNFTPGDYLRNAIFIKKPVSSWTEKERCNFVSILDDWLRKKVHPGYLDFNKVEYLFSDLVWGMKGGVAIGYHVPEEPITRRIRPINRSGLKVK